MKINSRPCSLTKHVAPVVFTQNIEMIKNIIDFMNNYTVGVRNTVLMNPIVSANLFIFAQDKLVTDFDTGIFN